MQELREKLSPKEISLGSVLKLKTGSFKKSPGAGIIANHHLFVVVSQDGSKYVVVPCSSQVEKLDKKGDRGDTYRDIYGAYEYKNWKFAGFSRPTFSGTKTSGYITFDEIYEVTGHLSETDTRGVVDKYNSVEQAKVLEGLNYNNTISFERFWKEFND